MTKTEFLAELRSRLTGVDADYTERIIEFFSEAIDDRMEAGMSEEEAVAGMGPVDEAARNAAADMPPVRGYRSESSANGWEEKHTGTESSTGTINITEPFVSINIEDMESDIEFVPSGNDEVCFIEFEEKSGVSHGVSVRSGVLTIVKDTAGRSWLERLLDLRGGKARIVVHMPATGYEMLMVKTTSGDITVPSDFAFLEGDLYTSSGDVKCFAPVEIKLNARSNSGDVEVRNGSAAIEAHTLSGDVRIGAVSSEKPLTISSVSGDVRAEQVKCGALNARSTSGDVKLFEADCTDAMLKSISGDVKADRLIASGSITAEATSGDVELRHCDGAELSLRTISGDIEAGLLSGKLFTASSKSGSVRVPQSIESGECRAKTLSGSIVISVELG